MRALIVGLSALAIAGSPHAAEAGLSTTPHAISVSLETTTVTDEASQETEDQIGLTKARRRAVQRDLSRLGYRTKINGKFDQSTRDAIGRWQQERSYPRTGFLNSAQQKELNESGAAGKSDHRDRRRGGGRVHRSHVVGGPFGLIGHAVGGLFGR